MAATTGQRHARMSAVRGALLFLSLVLVVAGCGESGDASGPSRTDVTISVTSGRFTSTARVDGVTEIPFSKTISVHVRFETSIYGSGGQTFVFAEVEPSNYRMTSLPRRNVQTYSFAITNRSPGTAMIRVYEHRDAAPITFTLQIGEQPSN